MSDQSQSYLFLLSLTCERFGTNRVNPLETTHKSTRETTLGNDPAGVCKTSVWCVSILRPDVTYVTHVSSTPTSISMSDQSQSYLFLVGLTWEKFGTNRMNPVETTHKSTQDTTLGNGPDLDAHSSKPVCICTLLDTCIFAVLHSECFTFVASCICQLLPHPQHWLWKATLITFPICLIISHRKAEWEAPSTTHAI